MYTAMRDLGRKFVADEAPAFAVAFVVAELFYKFHSFTLECLAFLATWYAFGLCRDLLSGRNRG